MRTIFIPVYPKPSGANVTELVVDFDAFDPHDGVRFAVVLKNPAGLVLDKTYTNLSGEDWQNWPAEQTSEADYNYVKQVVLENLGYTEAISPFIVTEPQSQKVFEGDSVQFSVVASGDSPISYEWMKEGSGIQATNSSTYSISNIVSSDLGSYSVKIINPAGSITSSSASLTFHQAPTITSQPQNLNIPVSGIGSINVGVMGDTPFSFQWYKNEQTIVGATGDAYVIQSASINDSGNYFVTINNIAGNVSSNIVSVTIDVPPQPPEP